MQDNTLTTKISQTILSYANSARQISFEKYMRDNITDPNELELFKNIWTTAINFENWNYSDLQIGYKKTTEILKDKYKLDESVCRQLASEAAYQWK